MRLVQIAGGESYRCWSDAQEAALALCVLAGKRTLASSCFDCKWALTSEEADFM